MGMTSRRLGRLASVGLALGLALGGQAAWAGRGLADELKEAQAALAGADYARAYQEFFAHADGNPLAQFSLGLFHQYGWGRPKDRAEACRWQEKAALGGIPAAQEWFAECLRDGVLRPADPAGAARWYERAIMSGMHLAACSLAELYMAGQGVPKDPAKAVELCRQAAEKGLPVAERRLANLLLEGDVSVRDVAAARRWLAAAARAGDGEAEYRLAGMLRDGVGGETDTAAARRWMETAAAQGWLPAYLPTAESYFNAPTDQATGLLPPEDLAKAYLWSAAAVRRLAGSPQAEPARALLNQVLARMPTTWRADLDRRVEAHLAKVAGLSEGGAP